MLAFIFSIIQALCGLGITLEKVRALLSNYLGLSMPIKGSNNHFRSLSFQY
ncbi:hypothetical protein SAMN05421743_101404 [Thalassobacillus cyri]|uniref:Uncharacterized protein n=1 Tax=Thalassobacillus cyri TaxID=571932 RepID=A0A1H3WEJ9_9BACI|nr:hypothetical protein SAMN05421743_101404 [Thalassobacillus cyri]